jgi:hypothetical protein
MNARIQAFEAYQAHPWLKKVYRKLTVEELSFVFAFLKENAGLDKGAFELKVNRLFLDQPNKPKHYREILELLTCSNSASLK